ncbi:hypothetical protein EDB83DRAFT_2320089 [Lactarius deliciosus]|nr:hypothetical protein EDB83DRAFT_2320089 [Lactarius deliciosus]
MLVASPLRLRCLVVQTPPLMVVLLATPLLATEPTQQQAACPRPHVTLFPGSSDLAASPSRLLRIAHITRPFQDVKIAAHPLLLSLATHKTPLEIAPAIALSSEDFCFLDFYPLVSLRFRPGSQAQGGRSKDTALHLVAIPGHSFPLPLRIFAITVRSRLRLFAIAPALATANTPDLAHPLLSNPCGIRSAIGHKDSAPYSVRQTFLLITLAISIR